MFKYKFAVLGCLIVPVFMRINVHGTGLETDPKRFIIPFLVGGVAGFFIGLMKDRWVRLNNELEFRIQKRTEELHKALNEVKTLQGILPICSNCKKVRDDKGYWNQIEGYIQKHSDAQFSHGICPECTEKLYPNLDNDK